MESWQSISLLLGHILAIYLSVELLPTKLNLRYLSLSIPLNVCLVSQLKRRSFFSLRELILSCSIFEKIDSGRVPIPFVVVFC